ncbi:GTPase IMAP family member 7-like [Anoplopoma fimbria]|uniref:GTPase IMAP family member 7-like n=1 Tax=Anoplopoma fimbria TaxID=229290 RepID=UPI0023ED2BE3|nr:GTPase IMAP family member 7-like [Anoplopoma fimbria]
MSNGTRIVILGKTGSGKSSLANTIFGDESFKIGRTAKTETSKCGAITKSVNGRNITLIDTPGFFDTDRSEEELKPEIVRCITECAPGPHAFLIVLKVDKFTVHEQAVIAKINQYFSEEVLKYSTVLFTYGDQLEEGQTIEDFVRGNELLSDLVKKCGGRCHVVDNKYWKNNQQDEYRNNQFQVKELLKTIEKITEANRGSYYTNEMLQAVEEEIKQEVELIRQSPGNMSEIEIREKAKDRVSDWLLIKLAGITTGVLLGAVFGVVVMVRVVVLLLEAGLSFAKIAKGVSAATAGAKSVIALTAVSGVVGAVLGGGTGYCRRWCRQS